MPSVFSLANIERGDFYDSSFIYYTKFLLATLGYITGHISSKHAQTSSSALRFSYHKFNIYDVSALNRKLRFINEDVCFIYTSYIYIYIYIYIYTQQQ